MKTVQDKPLYVVLVAQSHVMVEDETVYFEDGEYVIPAFEDKERAEEVAASVGADVFVVYLERWETKLLS